MGEARRRSEQGLPPRQSKAQKEDSPRVVSWIPITQKQKAQFYSITQRGAWIGIGAAVVFWLVVRIIGPAVGWWTPADAR